MTAFIRCQTGKNVTIFHQKKTLVWNSVIKVNEWYTFKLSSSVEKSWACDGWGLQLSKNTRKHTRTNSGLTKRRGVRTHPTLLILMSPVMCLSHFIHKTTNTSMPETRANRNWRYLAVLVCFLHFSCSVPWVFIIGVKKVKVGRGRFRRTEWSERAGRGGEVILESLNCNHHLQLLPPRCSNWTSTEKKVGSGSWPSTHLRNTFRLDITDLIFTFHYKSNNRCSKKTQLLNVN